AHERRHPFEPRHALVERILFGTEADSEKELGIAPDRLAEHVDRSFARLQLTGDELHERRLAGAVRPEQAGDAGRHGHRHVVEADALAVPLGQVIRDDDVLLGGDRHAMTSTPRTRRSRINPDATVSATMAPSDTIHGVSYFGGSRKMMSPICARSAGTEIQDIAVLRLTA